MNSWFYKQLDHVAMLIAMKVPVPAKRELKTREDREVSQSMLEK